MGKGGLENIDKNYFLGLVNVMRKDKESCK